VYIFTPISNNLAEDAASKKKIPLLPHVVYQHTLMIQADEHRCRYTRYSTRVTRL
jgi:hypothetical protein